MSAAFSHFYIRQSYFEKRKGLVLGRTILRYGLYITRITRTNKQKSTQQIKQQV